MAQTRQLPSGHWQRGAAFLLPSLPRPRPAGPRGQPRTYTMAGGATSEASAGCGSDGSDARRSAAGPEVRRVSAGGGLVRAHGGSAPSGGPRAVLGESAGGFGQRVLPVSGSTFSLQKQSLEIFQRKHFQMSHRFVGRQLPPPPTPISTERTQNFCQPLWSPVAPNIAQTHPCVGRIISTRVNPKSHASM